MSQPKVISFYTDPDNIEYARFSLETCVAIALCEGNMDNSTFTAQRIADLEMRKVMKRVQRHSNEKEIRCWPGS